MASLVTCVVSSLSFCVCSASASLLHACCGNDKPSTVAPSATSGRKRSVVLLLLSVALSLAFQYGVGPAILQSSSSPINVAEFVTNAWTDGCTQFSYDIDLQESCVGNMGVFRVGFATIVFFTLAGVGSWCKPTMNREAWPAKYVLYFLLVAAMSFVPNDPLFSKVYLNQARIGGVLFIFLQQVIIVDCAHNWNDSWVAKANKADAEELGAGKKWLGAILCSCAILFIGSFVGIVLMFVGFSECRTNMGFIASTLCLCVLVTVTQLLGEEGSLLSSASVSAWAVYLLYNAVTKNPNEVCNPMLGQSGGLSIALGLIITLMSLGWTGWSYTAEARLTPSHAATSDTTEAASETEKETFGKRKVVGVVTGETESTGNEDDYVRAQESQDENEAEDAKHGGLSTSWRLNAILVVVTCWTSMILTRWGDISTDGSVANPSVGSVAMWMIMTSQWLALLLYTWTLAAPKLFPERDFT
ncbi:serine incorporator 3 [Mayamaea pseudoterrestris]|nr:serine incorporator 3 [Mayamaea pseudoterrestris]